MRNLNSVVEGHKAGRAATVIVAVGGTPQTYARVAEADVTVMVDSVDELARVPARDTLIKVPAGDLETLQTLVERMSGDDLAGAIAGGYRGRPNILLSKGMAQDPRIGELVVRDLVRSGKMEAVARQAMNLVMVAANGALSHVEVVEVNSNAGGMGAGGGPEIGHYLAAHMEAFSRATVKHSMFRVGALTYLPVAPRAASNARLATKSNILRLGKQRAARRIQSLELVELPLRSHAGRVVGENHEQRDRLTSVLMQARRSPEVVELLDSLEVNDRAGEFGEFGRLAPSWSGFLDSRELVRGAAVHYLRAIGQRPNAWAGNSPAGEGREVVVVPGDLNIPAAEAVLDELRAQPHSDGPLLVRLLNEDQARHAGGIALKSGESSTPLDVLVRQFERGEVTEEYVGSLVAALRRKLSATRAEAAEARARRDTSRKTLRAALAVARKKARSPWNVILSKVESSRDAAARNTRLVRSFEPLVRPLVEQHTRFVHCLDAVEVLNTAIDLLERAANSRFAPLVAALTRLVGSGAPGTGRVRYKALADAAPKLGEAAAQNDEALADALLASVASVTLAGVAALFGVLPEPAAIVTALVESRYPWVAPMWGGASTYAEPRHRLVVFPPMQDDDFEALRREAELRGFRPLLRCAGSAAAGCAVVALDFYAVEEYADILPAFYESQPGVAPSGGDDIRAVAPAA